MGVFWFVVTQPEKTAINIINNAENILFIGYSLYYIYNYPEIMSSSKMQTKKHLLIITDPVIRYFSKPQMIIDLARGKIGFFYKQNKVIFLGGKLPY